MCCIRAEGAKAAEVVIVHAAPLAPSVRNILKALYQLFVEFAKMCLPTQFLNPIFITTFDEQTNRF